MRPGFTELCGDSKDNDCDDKIDCADETCLNVCTDYGGDGYSPVTGDCDDNDIWVHPGADPCNHDISTSSTDKNCNGRSDQSECNPSPVLIDVAGDGFSLTGVADGVAFDLSADGVAERLNWTSPGSDDAWLALDRDGNGRIDNGQELFGNFTPQPDPPPGRVKNGFLALAEYDKPGEGGNADGVVDARDAVFSSLRLWQDRNHNGISEAGELHAPSALGVESFSLDYREARRRDRHGNEFRYRAKVYGAGQRDLGRWAYDVFLVPAL